MGFWETAAAALVGGLGVGLIAGSCRLGWLFFRRRYTPYGRLETRVETQFAEILREMERREGGDYLGRTDATATLGGTMARPKTDDDATRSLKDGDKTQVAPKGTRIGLLKKSEVLADFKKIVRGKKS
jgi:hypothetical protein